MATCGFILSTGRTSTQNLAAIAARSHPHAIVEHEALGPNYFSRRVFREPARYFRVLGWRVPLQRKLIQIEDAVAAGTPYLDVGWPSYAWLPYFVDRFGDSLRFAHLVRNPFHVAASYSTLGMYALDVGPGWRFQQNAVMHTDDPNVHFTDIAAQGAQFSTFERNLFNWLELNQFMLEQHDKPGFLGVFRFEDLYKDDAIALRNMLNGLIGPSEPFDIPADPTDRNQRGLPEALSEPNADLVAAVRELAQRLGYSSDELAETGQIDRLNARYAQVRHAP